MNMQAQFPNIIRMASIRVSPAGARSFLRLFTPITQTRAATSISPAAASTSTVLQDAIAAEAPRINWTRDEIRQIYETPLHQLTHAAATVHRRFHDPSAIQLCTLMNIKVGGCSEDCSYCSQSSRYDTGLKATKMSSVDAVLEAARIAKENGSTRFCLGAAWRDMRGRKSSLRNVKQMISGVRKLDMEVCVTLGMIDGEQAKELKEAGLTAYNHNVDTSREFYPSIISTRTYDERLQTLSHVRDAGINVCSGGILGLGEEDSDRVGLLHTAATLPAHPESFPVNALVPIKGTPLGDRKPIEFDKLLRTVATARIILPKTTVRLSAGRINMTEEQQVACFMAGANSVFTGEKMLTTDCSGWEEDKKMFEKWGFYPMEGFQRGEFRGDTTTPS
ncbi:biotin synthase [Blastomyces dermatitidis ER-3]|uniref:biotin synthase n=5 Tax=Blastomyces TaxID=229219 RepID=A0A179UEI2_BLAGS|nr:biotin synthetase [Blastomyces gilchristii SLH14081]XP_045280487.1 biotin synthase [Blastomyces dermatitidis ER-3]EQL38468.1 biotin synthetase [Blastomyces dermatitidis ATCC 26199]OAT00760.1 biotin synthase [Blastomyces dermatitidis ER-3]OAT05679.1 biotin synthetase [Blastomyces gilchristii SLH14081]